MKFMYKDEFHSRNCSTMFLSTKIWSVHERPLLNPACSSLSHLSTPCGILWSRTLQKIFPGTDRRLIPLQLPHTERSPFFGSFTMMPFFQSSGTFSSSHAWLNSFTSICALRCRSALSMSAVRRSSPGALFPLFCLMADAISSTVIFLFFISIDCWGSALSKSKSLQAHLCSAPLGSARPTLSSVPPLWQAHE